LRPCAGIDPQGALRRDLLVDLPASRRAPRSSPFTPTSAASNCVRRTRCAREPLRRLSGAEIEQAIVAALYSAHAAGQPVTAAMVAREMQNTRPLAVVMAEKVAALRAWASGRTVSAD